MLEIQMAFKFMGLHDASSSLELTAIVLFRIEQSINGPIIQIWKHTIFYKWIVIQINGFWKYTVSLILLEIDQSNLDISHTDTISFFYHKWVIKSLFYDIRCIKNSIQYCVLMIQCHNLYPVQELKATTRKLIVTSWVFTGQSVSTGIIVPLARLAPAKNFDWS